MNSFPPSERLAGAYHTALSALLAERNPEGYWVGELSTSALSTATAVSALSLVGRARPDRSFDGLVRGGLGWLAADRHAETLRRADAYMRERFGATPKQQAEAVRARYGKDRTFAVPILTTCAL